MERIGKSQTHAPAWIDRGWYLVTEFEHSSSVNFRKAVALAQTHPGFIQLMDERNVLIYRNLYRAHDVRQFQQLYALIKNWKGTRLYFEGAETTYEQIESGITCYVRTKLEQPAEHEDEAQGDACRTFDAHRLETAQSLGCIGCRRSGISVEWLPEPDRDALPWFFYGRLDQHQVYTLDTDDIHQIVSGHLAVYVACPLLDLDAVAQSVRRLPKRIDPRKDREWEYRKSANADDSPGRRSRMPGVLPRSQDAYRLYLKRIL